MDEITYHIGAAVVEHDAHASPEDALDPLDKSCEVGFHENRRLRKRPARQHRLSLLDQHARGYEAGLSGKWYPAAL